jgi:hypothetical protein
MSQDLEFIRSELKNCEEIETYQDLVLGNHVKYITIKDNDEYFYTGGIYKRLGDNKIFLKHGGSTRSVPLTYKNKEGEVIYKTRLFNQINNNCSNNEIKEYKKIIHNQQNIIETLNKQLKKQTLIIQKLQR